MKTVGQIIREARENKGLLQRQLAASLDIDTAILSKFERNERKISKELLIKLAEILKLDAQDLFLQYQGEQIAYELVNEIDAAKILKVAEKKVEYLKKKNETIR